MLRPLLRDRKNSYATLDIETGREGQILDVAIYDGSETRFFTSWDTFLAFLIEHKEDKIYRKFIAHNGGGFDYVSLVDHLTNRTKIKYEAIMSQSKIVVLYVFLAGQRFEFIDSANVLVNASLADLSKIFAVEHGKLEGIDRQDIEGEKRRDPDRYYEYLRLDVVSLYEICKAFEKYLEIDFFPITAASLSLYLYRRRFQKHLLFKPSERVDKFISEAYAGGRVEVFRPGEHEAINVYDINSLYPSVMRDAEYPVGTPVVATKFHPDRIGVYKVKFRQLDRTIPPLLWYKNTVNGLEFVYEGEGYFFDPELRLALDHGVEIEVEKGYIWLRSAPLFREFVDFYYKMRTENKGNALDYICKIMLNSLYGKFGQKENKYVLTRLNYAELLDKLDDHTCSVKEYDPKRGLYEVSQPRRINHRIVNLAAQVTSLGRVVLNSEIIANAGRVVYCDTDSVHIQGEFEPGKLSAALGAWKLESSGLGIYTGRKQYVINDKIRFKGIKTKDTLGNGQPVLSTADLKLISDGGTVLKRYSYFPKLKNVLKTGKKSCRIYKMAKIGQRGAYFSNFRDGPIIP
jgi:hypothetical protein